MGEISLIESLLGLLSCLRFSMEGVLPDWLAYIHVESFLSEGATLKF
jgi:hypothetical protein